MKLDKKELKAIGGLFLNGSINCLLTAVTAGASPLVVGSASAIASLGAAITGNIASNHMATLGNLSYDNLINRIKKKDPNSINHDLEKMFREASVISLEFIKVLFLSEFNENQGVRDLTTDEKRDLYEGLNIFFNENIKDLKLVMKDDSLPIDKKFVEEPSLFLENLIDQIFRMTSVEFDAVTKQELKSFYINRIPYCFELAFKEVIKKDERGFKAFQIWILENVDQQNEQILKVQEKILDIVSGSGKLIPMEQLDEIIVAQTEQVYTHLAIGFKKITSELTYVTDQIRRDFDQLHLLQGQHFDVSKQTLAVTKEILESIKAVKKEEKHTGTFDEEDSEWLEEKNSDILKYLDSLVAENKNIRLPSVSEKFLLPEIPLEKVFVTLKMHQSISEIELTKAQQFFYEKIRDKIKDLGHNPSEDEQLQIEADILNEYPVMNALRNDRRNSKIYGEETGKSSDNVTINFIQAFQRERFLVILGGPGSGKSTLTKWICLQLASGMRKNIIKGTQEDVTVPGHSTTLHLVSNGYSERLGPARFPVLVKVADYAKAYEEHKVVGKGPLPLIDYICLVVSQEWVDGDRVVKAFLKMKKAVILLDGMDEINTSRREINNEIEKFIKDWIKYSTSGDSSEEDLLWKQPCLVGGNQIIITSRIVGYQQASLNKTTLTHVTIEPMEEDSIRHFCDIWTRQVNVTYNKWASETDLEKQIANESELLKNAILNDPKTSLFATNPLTLTLLAVVYKVDKKLPTQRVELFERLSEMLVERWRDCGLTIEQVYYVLPDVASFMHSQNDRISTIELTREVKKSFAKYKGINEEVISLAHVDEVIVPFIKKLQEQIGLMAESGVGTYQFYHRSFQEFFAAIALVRQKENIVATIVNHLEDPIWREPIQLALEYTALKNKRIDFKISITTKELVKGLIDADDPIKDLIPRTSFLIATSLPDMEDLEEEMVHDIVRDLLQSYLDEQGQRHNAFLKAKIENVIERLFASNRKYLIEKIFLKILGDQNNSKLILAVSYLIYAKKWFSDKYELPFQNLLPIDSPHLDFPIFNSLRRYYSSIEGSGGSPKLYFRKKILAEPNLYNSIVSNPLWLQLIIALYGGLQDEETGKTWVYHQELLYKLNTKAGTSDERYTWAVILDTEMGRNTARILIKPEFNPKYIYRESFHTKEILATLINNQTPGSLKDYFIEVLGGKGDNYKKAEALLALSILDRYSIPGILQTIDADIATIFNSRIKQVQIMLKESLQHYFAFYIRKRKDLMEIAESVKEENRKEFYYLLDSIKTSLGLPPYDICYSIPEKRLTDSNDKEFRVCMETEGWIRRFSYFSSDPEYNMSVLLDSVANELKSDISLFINSLSRIPLHSKLILFKGEQKNDLSFPITAIQNSGSIVGVFDALPYIQNSFSFVKDWILWSLRDQLVVNSDLLPEAILHSWALSNPRKMKSAFPDFWKEGKQYDKIKLTILNIGDPYLKFRSYLILFKQTLDYSAYTSAVSLLDIIDNPVDKITAIISILQLRSFVFIISDKYFISYLSNINELRRIAFDLLPKCNSLEVRVLLKCKLISSLEEEPNIEDLDSIFSDIESIQNPSYKYDVITGCLDIFEKNRDIKSKFEEVRKGVFNINLLTLLSDQDVAELPTYLSILDLYNFSQNFTTELQKGSNNDLMWIGLLSKESSALSYRDLINLAIKQGAIMLNPTACSVLTQCVKIESRPEVLMNLFSYCYLPDVYNYQLIEQWHESDINLQRFASLLLAEQGKLSEKIINDIVYLLEEDNDRMRFRASIAIHGRKPSNRNADRKFLMSKISSDEYMLISKTAAISNNPFVSNKLKWFDHNLVHNSVDTIKSFIEKIVNRAPGYSYLERCLGFFEYTTDSVDKDLLNFFGSSDSAIKRSLIRSFLRLANINQELATEFAGVLTQKELDVLRSLNCYDFNFDQIADSIINELMKGGEMDNEELIEHLDMKVRAIARIDFEAFYLSGTKELAKALNAGGKTFYVNPTQIVSLAKEASNRLQKHPNLLPFLMQWTFTTLQKDLIEESDSKLGAYLMLLLCFLVENNPDTYANDPIIERFDVEKLLSRNIKENKDWVVRRGAIVLLSYLNEKTEISLEILTDCMKDIFFVQQGVEICWRYFENVYKSVKCINKLSENLNSESGYIASTSAKILSEIARSKKCPEVQRKVIISILANCLRKEISSPTGKRVIYLYDEDDFGDFVNRGLLEEVLYNELLNISAV